MALNQTAISGAFLRQSISQFFLTFRQPFGGNPPLVSSALGKVSNYIGGFGMLLEYIQAALRRAKYEILPDDGSYYGEIIECAGV